MTLNSANQARVILKGLHDRKEPLVSYASLTRVAAYLSKATGEDWSVERVETDYLLPIIERSLEQGRTQRPFPLTRDMHGRNRIKENR